ncbi:hypothetical protein ZWY2020_032476 [Hordeum vulgare]|nr:hypothetical protein ZWY2020_032476 [Hordeum vulgare]
MLSSELVIKVTSPPPPHHTHDMWLTFSMEEKCTELVTVEIPKPKLLNKPPECMDEYEAMQLELGEYGSSSPRKKKILLYRVMCHMKEMVDHGPLLPEDLSAKWLSAEGEDLTRKHKFKTALGKIDDTHEQDAVSYVLCLI